MTSFVVSIIGGLTLTVAYIVLFVYKGPRSTLWKTSAFAVLIVSATVVLFWADYPATRMMAIVYVGFALAALAWDYRQPVASALGLETDPSIGRPFVLLRDVELDFRIADKPPNLPGSLAILIILAACACTVLVLMILMAFAHRFWPTSIEAQRLILRAVEVVTVVMVSFLETWLLGSFIWRLRGNPLTSLHKAVLFLLLAGINGAMRVAGGPPGTMLFGGALGPVIFATNRHATAGEGRDTAAY